MINLQGGALLTAAGIALIFVAIIAINVAWAMNTNIPRTVYWRIVHVGNPPNLWPHRQNSFIWHSWFYASRYCSHKWNSPYLVNATIAIEILLFITILVFDSSSLACPSDEFRTASFGQGGSTITHRWLRTRCLQR